MQHFYSIIFQDLKELNWNSITSTSFVQQERQSLTSLPQVWGSWGFEEKLSGSPIHLCNSPNSRVTELALTVERLQDQNLEKDQLNKVLGEKLEALVRRGVGREGPDIG